MAERAFPPNCRKSKRFRSIAKKLQKVRRSERPLTRADAPIILDAHEKLPLFAPQQSVASRKVEGASHARGRANHLMEGE